MRVCLGPRAGVTHYHTQLGLPDKGREIKKIVVLYLTEYLGCLDRKGDIAFFSYPWLLDLVLQCLKSAPSPFEVMHVISQEKNFVESI